MSLGSFAGNIYRGNLAIPRGKKRQRNMEEMIKSLENNYRKKKIEGTRNKYPSQCVQILQRKKNDYHLKMSYFHYLVHIHQTWMDGKKMK